MRFSVIIPIYQAEKTIERCLDSLVHQSFSDSEILLIDDGSTDRSGEICKEYCKKDSRLRYFYKENGGVSSARNLGLEKAAGEHILFVDSDDYVTPDFFAAIDAVLSAYDYDLIQFSNHFTDGQKQTSRIREPFQARTREGLLPKLIETLYQKKSNGPVAKVYKAGIVREHQIQFPEDIEVGEDLAFFIHYSFYMNSYCVSDHPLYVVNTENEQSLSRKRRNDLDEQTERMNRYLDLAMQRAGVTDYEREEYGRALNYDRLRMVYSKAKTLHREGIPLRKRLKEIRGYCREVNQLNLSYPDTRYCRITSLPIRRTLTLVIDAIAWKLTH